MIKPVEVILVDDDEMMLAFVADYLARQHSVREFGSGEGALAWIRAGGDVDGRARIAVVDLDMPGMDGLTLIGHIRAQRGWKHVPIVVLSARDASAERIRSYQTGADHFLAKPFNPDELLVVIQVLLRRRS